MPSCSTSGSPSRSSPPTETPTRLRTLYQPRTLEFASPEQVSNRPVTLASDVYSLGVVLYRLLAGRLPYASRGLTAGQAERLSASDSPAARERGVPAAGEPRNSIQLAAKLRGDLDNVLAMALWKDPGDAIPPSTSWRRTWAISSGGPVCAHAPSRLYPAGKFLARHRGVVAAALVAPALVAGAAIASGRRRGREGKHGAPSGPRRPGRPFRGRRPVFWQSPDDVAGGAPRSGRGRAARGSRGIRAAGPLARHVGHAARGQGLFDQSLELAPARDLAEGARRRSPEMAGAAFLLAAGLQTRADSIRRRRAIGGRSRSFGDGDGGFQREADALQGLCMVAEPARRDRLAARYYREALDPAPALARAGLRHRDRAQRPLRRHRREARTRRVDRPARPGAQHRPPDRGRRPPGDRDDALDLAARRHEAGDLAGAESLYRQALASKRRRWARTTRR